MKVIRYAVALAVLLLASPLFAAERPVVVELFTSQGCASCPMADEIMKKIAANSHYLPLSFHVTYFDGAGWKDPFATKANNDRQARYAHQFGYNSLFTPQMVVDGRDSVAGSNSSAVARALERAQSLNAGETIVPVSITATGGGDGLDVQIGGGEIMAPQDATLYEVHFNRSVMTPIQAGANGGKTVENINNVVAFFPISIMPRYYVPIANFNEDGIAYILQASNGKVLGAGYYLKP